MRAEIVSVGTELLLGNIVNTNAAYIAQELARFGIDVYHHSTVGDNLSRCAETIAMALSRCDAVIVTGGIGPTPDDATRAAIATALGVELEERPELVEVIRERYARRQREPNKAALNQANMPVGSEVIPNPTGTAPGILAATDGKALYAMPGVPSEMKRMLHESVLPDLRERFELDSALYVRVLRCRGIGESDLAEHLREMLETYSNPTVATYVKTGEVEVRITARARDESAADELIAPVEEVVRERIGQHIYAVGADAYEEQLARLLRETDRTLATAESCTGGLIGDRVTAVAGSSAYYVGGVVAYSNAVKESLLGVRAEVLQRDGAVSEAAAKAMARGVAERLGADWGLATTGIAGPDGGTAEKPVGLVYVAVYDRHEGEATAVELRLSGDRSTIKERTVLEALELVCQRIAGSKR
ncbi:MAG: competence/damage-inducible protein A [Armatimonadetes bacterium]|nr:competence/damage-inducible protein A [Armatimonadota bacterium]